MSRAATCGSRLCIESALKSGNMSSIKRNRVLVDPAVQWALGRRLVVHWGLFFLLLITVGMALRWVFSLAVFGVTGAALDAVRQQVPQIVLMFLLLPIFIRDSMKLSHRFVGPMYRVRTVLATLGSGGSVAPVKLRNGDFWQETAMHLNEVRQRIEMLELRKAQLEVENRRLSETLEALGELGSLSLLASETSTRSNAIDSPRHSVDVGKSACVGNQGSSSALQ